MSWSIAKISPSVLERSGRICVPVLIQDDASGHSALIQLRFQEPPADQDVQDRLAAILAFRNKPQAAPDPVPGQRLAILAHAIQDIRDAINSTDGPLVKLQRIRDALRAAHEIDMP